MIPSTQFGQYVVAGVDTYVGLMSRYMNKYDTNAHFNSDDLNNFMTKNVNRYLYSFGTGLNYKTKKMSKNHVKKIAQNVHVINNAPFMNNSKLYIDSGGFQVAMGAVPAAKMPDFMDKYHTFLQDEKNQYSYAFMLDLPPGPGSGDIFDSFDQVERLNRQSYQLSGSLPKDVKDKMIYIHHFRTPSLYASWSKFMWQEGLADGYQNFGTGGIVASKSTDVTIPVIIYTIPLASILRYVISKGMTSFNFHILGGANTIDVFYHKLFTKHIKEVHGIDINITYDSSVLFKGLAIGRFIPVRKESGDLYKMSIRSKDLHMQFDKCTVEDKVFELLNELAEIYSFKTLDKTIEPIYNVESGTLDRSVHMYLICYMLQHYRQLELLSERFVDSVYPLYQSGEISLFDEQCMTFTKHLNQGKSTRKQKAKTYSIFKSLNVLTNLDEDYNKFLVNKFMSSEDNALIDGAGTIKF